LEKKQIRRLAIERRAALSRGEYWQLNDDLLEELKKFDWRSLSCINIFLPINEKKEVDTYQILSYFKEEQPHLKITVNRSDLITKSLTPIFFDYENTVLVKNKYQIPEPLYGKECALNEIDAVFCPLLSFDLEGNRVGYGAGYYDLFLARCKPTIIKIGLSLFSPIESISDINSFDIKLTHCLIPQKTYTF
jgi:5-formyltetrahydrofolate cyclo-ligase